MHKSRTLARNRRRSMPAEGMRRVRQTAERWQRLASLLAAVLTLFLLLRIGTQSALGGARALAQNIAPGRWPILSSFGAKTLAWLGLPTQDSLAPVAGAVSPSQSSIAITGPHRADGVDAATVSVTLRDEAGNPLPGVRVVLRVDGKALTVSGPSAPTDSDGLATARITSTSPGPASIVAYALEPGLSTRLAATAHTVFRAA